MIGGIFHLHFYTLVGWSLASGLHPCSDAMHLCPGCGLVVGRAYFPAQDLEHGHTSFFGQHVRRDYMSKDLHMLRWLVWSFGHLSTLRWIYSGKPLAQGEREAYGGGLIKVSPAELIEVSRALADPLTFAQETKAYRCMPRGFRVFLHSVHAVANYTRDSSVHVESLVKETEGLTQHQWINTK